MKLKIYSRKRAQKDLPRRHSSANKTQGGKILIFAGSKGMWGASVLCAKAAARVGAGYVYLQPSEKGFPSINHPDFLLFDSKSKNTIAKIFKAVAIGPGVRSVKILQKQIRFLQQVQFAKVVLDAGALTALSSSQKILPSTWILTPHEGEMARLLDVSSKWVKANRQKAVLEAQKKFGCVVLLKGHRTLVTDAKNFYEVRSGNVALAKAGTGDVLTGMIAGFLGQGLSSVQASCLAAFVHGAIADRWASEEGDYLSLMASDLVERLPGEIKKLRNLHQHPMK